MTNFLSVDFDRSKRHSNDGIYRKQIIKKMKTICSKIPRLNCSDSTFQEYKSIYYRYLNNPNTYNIQKITNKNSYWKEKRALQSMAKGLTETIQKISQKNGISDENQNLIVQLFNLLDRNDLVTIPYGCPISNPAPKKSKKKSLGDLPENWEDIFWKKIPKKSQYRSAIAVMIALGPRPSEIQNGIKVIADETNHHIKILALGTKRGVDDENGQEARLIEVNCSEDKNGPEKYLFELARGLGQGGYTIYCSKPKNLSAFTTYWGTKLFGKLKAGFSPYSFRHQFTSDLKSSKKFSREQIAMMLGHRSDRTQKMYGYARNGHSGRKIEGVEATNPVRLHNSNESNIIFSF